MKPEAKCIRMQISPCGKLADVFFRVEEDPLGESLVPVFCGGEAYNVFFLRTSLKEAHQYKLGDKYEISTGAKP